MTSVNTNYGALVALQSLSQTTRELGMVQNRVNTGLKVASAKDNGAVFAIAEGQRTRVASLSAVRDGIDRATSVIDVGLSAGEAIGDILKQMKEKAVAAQATDLSATQRSALQADFDALRDQIDQIAGAATFNGANLVNGANLTGGGNAMRVLTTDGAGAGGAAAAGQFARGAAADGTVVGSSLSLTSDITSATVAGGTGQGLEANDTIDIAVGTTTYQVGITAGDTLGDVIDNINTATNGRVVASFDDDTGQVLYTSQESFTVTVNDDTGTTDADTEVEALFNGSSIAYVGGGGYQLTGGALSTAASSTETLGAIGATVAGGNDVLTLTLLGDDGASGGGDDRTFQITLDANSTVAEFVAQVSDSTGGAVSALYDETTGTLTYRSDEDFSVALSNNGVTGTFFGAAANASAGASLAPSSGGGSGSSANQVVLSGFDFRLGKAGQALSGVTSTLDVSTAAGGEAASTAIDAALTSLNRDLASLGAQSKALTVQKTFLGKLSDSIEAGIGNLVDADLAKESAKLQALQVKQQLGAQALSIANQAPSIVLSFFR